MATVSSSRWRDHVLFSHELYLAEQHLTLCISPLWYEGRAPSVDHCEALRTAEAQAYARDLVAIVDGNTTVQWLPDPLGARHTWARLETCVPPSASAIASGLRERGYILRTDDSEAYLTAIQHARRA